MVLAEATALAIHRIAEATGEPGGMTAVNLQVAEKYVEAFANLAREGNTLIVPSNLSDLAGLVSSALTIVRGNAGKVTWPE